MFAEESGSAFWVAIIVAVGSVLMNIVNTIIAYLSKRSSDNAEAASKVNTGLIAENTEKTVQTQATVNGRMDELVRVTREKAHAEGFIMGREESMKTILAMKVAEAQAEK